MQVVVAKLGMTLICSKQNIKTLQDLLPVCMVVIKKKGEAHTTYWKQVASTHGWKWKGSEHNIL
jgi:hypothetical protein